MSLKTFTDCDAGVRVGRGEQDDEESLRARWVHAAILQWRIRIGVISFTLSGDENGKREEDLEEEIKDVKERFRDAEVRTAYAFQRHDVNDASKLYKPTIVMRSLLKAQLFKAVGQSDPECDEYILIFEYSNIFDPNIYSDIHSYNFLYTNMFGCSFVSTFWI